MRFICQGSPKQRPDICRINMAGGSAGYRTRCAVHGLGNPRFLCGLLLPNQRHAPPGSGVVSFCMSGPIFESMSENMVSRPGADRTGTIVIFFILLTASVIPGWAFSTYALSTISGPHYFASPENRWVELFVPYLPTSVK